jgi:hypothetical protein
MKCKYWNDYAKECDMDGIIDNKDYNGLNEMLIIIESMIKDDFIYNLPINLGTNHIMFENGYNTALQELKEKILNILSNVSSI